jgi:hypothetical protein
MGTDATYRYVFSNDVLTLEEGIQAEIYALITSCSQAAAAAGTQFAASDTAKSIFATIFDGNKWMIYYNTLTQVLHWDFVRHSHLKFACTTTDISSDIRVHYPASSPSRWLTTSKMDSSSLCDMVLTSTRPTTNLNTNLTQVGNVGQLWPSPTLTNFVTSLAGTFASGNAGNLIGNRMFYSNDYMVYPTACAGYNSLTRCDQVHRGTDYVTTLKMYSSRTKNTEYSNSQNVRLAARVYAALWLRHR